MSKHEFVRIRREVVRRTLQLSAKQQFTPNMLRLTFWSEELGGFQSPSADDHIKIFLPAKGERASAARDFTPRTWNPTTKTLTLDFALHAHGPAVDWARGAQIGDRLEIAGPRGSTIAPKDFAWYLLVGDATALPSIGRRLEELPPDAIVFVVALVAGSAETAYLANSDDRRQITWLISTGDAQKDAGLVRNAVQACHLPAGDGFIWIAAEVAVARSVYRYAAESLGHPREWMKAAGYWSAGRADGGERIA